MPENRWRILVVVATAQLMVVLDSTIVNVALPTAQRSLHFGDSARSWVITAYALAFGSLLLGGGRVGDLVGRKTAFVAGLAVFAVASGVGGAAPTFGVLVAARAVQGAGGAVLAPAALSMLVSSFPDPRERGRAFATFSSVAVSGSAVGLILGGLLTRYLSWRWCMYVNVAFALAAALGALAWMTDERPAVRPRVDLTGLVLVSVGMFALVFGFSHAELSGWGASATVAGLVAGGLLLLGFLLVEQRVANPLLPLRVVTDRTRGAAYLSVAIAGTAMFGLSLFLTYFLQSVKGFSPVASGFAFVPMVACIVFSSNVANRVTMPRFGPRVVITAGMSLDALALAWLTRLSPSAGYATHVLPSLLLVGLGVGMVMSPSMDTATSTVRPEDTGVAAALVNSMQQLGGSVGIAVLSTVAEAATRGFATPGPAALTHGYVVALGVVAGLLLAGAVVAATCFPARTPAPASGLTELAVAEL